MSFHTTAYKDYESQGFVPEPDGYIQIPAPMPEWSRTINGHTITQKVIRKTLRKCRDAGIDMWYVADKLHVGRGAVVMFMHRAQSIPETVAESFYQLFSSGEPLPKAQGRKLLDWAEPEKPERHASIIKPPPTPDYDGKALGAAVARKRREAQMTLQVLARRAKCSATYISDVELGTVNYKSTRCVVLFRLCDVLGVDIRLFELKPRVDFAKFRQIASKQMQKRNISGAMLSRISGASEYWISRQITKPRYPPNAVTYLDDNVQNIMEVLGLSLDEILITRKEQ